MLGNYLNSFKEENEEVNPKKYIKCPKCNDNGCIVEICNCKLKRITKDDINKAHGEINDRIQRIKRNA